MLVFCHRRCKLCFLHACVVDIAVILYDSIVYFLLFFMCPICMLLGITSVHASFICLFRQILQKLRHRDLRRTYSRQVAPRKSPVCKLSKQPVRRHFQHISEYWLIPVINKNLRPQSTGGYQQLILIRRKLWHLLQIIRLVALMSMLAHSENRKSFLISDQEPQIKIVGQARVLDDLYPRIKRHDHRPQVVVI